ncbi:hypothetical protein D3C81_440530 [compost metagenome]
MICSFTRKGKPTFLASLALILALCLAQPATPAHAAAPAKNAVLMAKTGSAYVPLRFLNGYAGGSAVFDESLKQITLVKDGVTLSLTLGVKEASLGGVKTKLSQAPYRENGTVYVPLGILIQAFGLKAEWDNAAGAVTLTDAQGTASRLPVQSGSLPSAGTKAVVTARKSVKAAGRSFSIQTVTVPLLHPSVSLSVVLAGNNVGRTEELRSIAKRSSAAAAINGTFFDAYTSSSFKAPYGYIASGGKLLKNSPADRRAVFAYDHNGLAALVPGQDFLARFQAGEFEGGLQAGPRLLVDGKVSLNVAAEGFRDPKILTGGGARSALGLTKDHKLLLVTVPGATIPQLAEIMKQAGAYQAMNLDGGASSGLYAGGQYLTTPGRLISNALVVSSH